MARKVQIYHHVISTALTHPHMHVCVCVCVLVESMARRDIVLSEKTIILESDVALITTKSSS